MSSFCIDALGSNILVTGVAGFIGFHLAKRLLDNSCRVVGIDNLNEYYDPKLKRLRLSILQKYPKFTFSLLDLVNQDSLDNFFKEGKPSIVVNLAAQAGVRYSIDHPREYINSNIVGFFNVLEACRHYPVKHLIYASSSSVYGNQQKTPFSVEDKTDSPISLYAATKKSDELMAYTYSHLYGIPATGLRFFTVYGPYGRPDMAYFKFADAIMANRPIKIYNNGDMMRDFTYIDDVVDVLVKILYCTPEADEKKVRHKVYNVGNNHPEQLMNFVSALEEALGQKAIVEFLPMQPGDVYQTYADIKDLEAAFVIRPKTTVRVGLQKFAEWYIKWHGLN